MSVTSQLCRIGTIAAVLLVSACGNDPQVKATTALLRSALPGGGGTQAADPAPQGGVTQEGLARVLAATPNSVMTFALESNKQQVPLIQIERNRAYRTYATATRQSLTFKYGMVTATRGLGNDVMSVDADRSTRLISARQPGQAQRAMRFLRGDDVTIDMQFDCVISHAGGDGALTAMREDCRSGETTFINTYVVSGGTIVGSRQWLGKANGYATIALLRD